MTATAPPPLPANLAEGLKRLKMAAIRRLAPELLFTAKTQRSKPEEFLGTLVEAEISAREASNDRTQMRQAALPVTRPPSVEPRGCINRVAVRFRAHAPCGQA